MNPPKRYMFHGDVHTGIPPNQFGFGYLKVNPYQKGYGMYNPKTRRRRQQGRGMGDVLRAIGRKILPVAKQIGQEAAKESMKNIPHLLTAKDKKAAAVSIAKSIGKNVGRNTMKKICQEGRGGVKGGKKKKKKKRTVQIYV